MKPFSENQLQKMDMTAVSMMDALASNRPEVVIRNFDHRSFSKRLGKKFFSFKKEEQGFLMGILMNSLAEQIFTLSQTITKAGLKLQMIDARHKGKVSQVTIKVMDAEEESTITYFVLYLKENVNGDFVLVNFYDVFSGKSFSQLAQDLLAIDFENENIARLFEKQRFRILEARHLESFGNYQEAYMQMDSVTTEFRNFGVYPVYRALLSSHLNDSLYLKELENLKQITPNHQSVLFYDCISTYVKTDEKDQSECLEEFLIELLDN
ncbi:hypothetical protein NMS_1895 [Nonlabens marinus S1-08]|uniref:Uncharacterized protein n=1 Tax=Nonlabens marinus S1-08 TaxID=1454201 RepID=W8VQU5_9FLAO|nr:hypothetical protein NMS_1895 [Nonlabens marinus S1-08]